MKSEQIVTEIGKRFNCLGGGHEVMGNPIVALLKDGPLLFTTGTSVAAVVEVVLEVTAAPDLLAACKDARQYLSGIKIPTRERMQQQFAIVTRLEDAISKADAKAKPTE